MGKQETQKSFSIFLSHASEDKEQVRDLCERLREDGFDPWLDEERLLPGQDWNLEIEKAMRASDAILLCFSELSVVKEGYVQREYKKADSYSEEKPEGTIFTIPVRLDDCEIPHFIRDKQWADYPAGYDRLVQALQIRAGGTAMPKKVSKPKADHEENTNQSSGGSTFNIAGGVHAKRDVIMGNQYKTTYNNQQTYNITSPAEFMDELQKLKDSMPIARST